MRLRGLLLKESLANDRPSILGQKTPLEESVTTAASNGLSLVTPAAKSGNVKHYLLPLITVSTVRERPRLPRVLVAPQREPEAMGPIQRLPPPWSRSTRGSGRRRPPHTPP